MHDLILSKLYYRVHPILTSLDQEYLKLIKAKCRGQQESPTYDKKCFNDAPTTFIEILRSEYECKNIC